MNNNIHNIKSSIGNIISAATGAVAATTTLAADITGAAAAAVTATPEVGKALLMTPFSAAEGYIMETDGLSQEEAKAIAERYISQPASVTVAQAARASGKLAAALFADEPTNDDNANTVK